MENYVDILVIRTTISVDISLHVPPSDKKNTEYTFPRPYDISIFPVLSGVCFGTRFVSKIYGLNVIPK